MNKLIMYYGVFILLLLRCTSNYSMQTFDGEELRIDELLNVMGENSKLRLESVIGLYKFIVQDGKLNNSRKRNKEAEFQPPPSKRPRQGNYKLLCYEILEPPYMLQTIYPRPNITR